MAVSNWLELINSIGFLNVGSERVVILRKLKTLSLAYNGFNESVITSLSILSSLTNLDLSYNQMSGSFPAQGTCYDLTIYISS